MLVKIRRSCNGQDCSQAFNKEEARQRSLDVSRAQNALTITERYVQRKKVRPRATSEGEHILERSRRADRRIPGRHSMSAKHMRNGKYYFPFLMCLGKKAIHLGGFVAALLSRIKEELRCIFASTSCASDGPCSPGSTTLVWLP